MKQLKNMAQDGKINVGGTLMEIIGLYVVGYAQIDEWAAIHNDVVGMLKAVSVKAWRILAIGRPLVGE